MEVVLESVKGSFVLTILVGVWVAVLVAAAICHKAHEIQKSVHAMREAKSKREALLANQNKVSVD
jgi:hypothetical protein